MDIQSIIELIVIGLIIIGLAIYYVPKAIQNHWFNQIADCAKQSIKEAEEKFPGEGKGAEKKAYVMSAVKNKCDELGIPYNIIWKLISKFVDGVIESYNIIKK